MLYRPWNLPQNTTPQAAALAKELQVSRLVCGVLASRGITDAAAAREVLYGGDALSDGLQMQNMDKAVQRILQAVDGGQRITVFGDYDVDGVSATALLYMYLDSIGADVYYKLPSREEDGYGLSEGVVDLLASKGVKLIITVDSGVSAVQAVAYAAQKGIDVVVTDHHLPQGELPAAAAVVDPQLPGDASPCKTLCGVGVALKLAAALEGVSPEEMLPYYGDLVAIGTVADIMELTGENRTIVKKGLQMLQNTEREGLAALIAQSGLQDKAITADSIAYALAPRLNAAGRMDSANEALELLLCDDADEAQALAASLNEKNTARQETEQQISNDILEKISADGSYADDRILVVWGEGYHAGVIGIVASRLVERFAKPAIVISVDENGEGKGSGRSLADVSLHSALCACDDLLLRYGGHAMAAGLSVRRENLPALRQRLNEWVKQNHPVLHAPPLQIDAELSLMGLNADTVQELDMLAPFGCGNPAPVFLVRGATVEGVYAVGNGKHSRLRLQQGGGSLYAALFGTPPEGVCYKAGSKVDAAVSLSVYEGKNGPAVSARIRDMRPAGLTDNYLEPLRLYQAFSGGTALTVQQKQQLLPQRADTVALYRMAQTGIFAADLRPLFAALGEQNTGKALVSLQALQQLGLVQTQQQNGAEYICAVRGAAKRDLADAAVLRALEE